MKSKIVFLMFILLFAINSNAQNIKLFEHFSYDLINSQFDNKWINYNMDSSAGSTNFNAWQIRYKDKNGFSLRPYLNSIDPNYDLKGNNRDTSGIVLSGFGNNVTKKLNDWLVFKNQLNVGINDSVAFIAGGKVYDDKAPFGLGSYKPDTLEIWLSDKQLNTEPSNMNIFVGYAIVKDT